MWGDPKLKLYIIEALRTEDDEFSIADWSFGEAPFEEFYRAATGRDVDPDEDGYEEIPGVADFLLTLDVSDAAATTLRYLGLEAGNSAYETLVCPYWDFEDGVTTVDSLEGLQSLPNLEELNASILAPACSLEPLTRLPRLKRLSGLSVRCKDYEPLTRIPALEKLVAFGVMLDSQAFASYRAAIEALRARGVEVDDRARGA